MKSFLSTFSRQLFVLGIIFFVPFFSLSLCAAETDGTMRYKIVFNDDGDLCGGSSGDGTSSPSMYDDINDVLACILAAGLPAELCAENRSIAERLKSVIKDSLVDGIHELVTIVYGGELVAFAGSASGVENASGEGKEELLIVDGFPMTLDVFALPSVVKQFRREVSPEELVTICKNLADYADGRLGVCEHKGDGVYAFQEVVHNGLRVYFSLINRPEGERPAILIKRIGDKGNPKRQRHEIANMRNAAKKAKRK